MRLSLITTVAFGAMMALPSAAIAQDDSGFYVGGNVGAGKHFSNDLSGGLEGDIDGKGALDTALVAGYDFGNNWRLELEGSELYRDALGKIGGATGSKATLRTTGYMGNVLYDFDDLDLGSFKPYVGLGAGMMHTSLRATAHGAPLNEACTLAGVDSCRLADSDKNFAVQGLVGGLLPVTKNLSLNAQGKIFSAGDMSFVGNETSSGPLNVDLGKVIGGAVLVGAIWKFLPKSAPAPVYTPPPPPPAPAPEPVFEPAPEPVYEPAPEPAPAPQTYTCSNGTLVYDLSSCPVEPVIEQTTYACSDGSFVYDQAQCPQPVQQVASLNVCGPSPVAIFDVDLTATPKPLNRLGTMPEFGDSHGLSSDQFYEKLKGKYAANENGDRAYLNYLFKSMGYAGGFSEAQSYMFSEEVLPVGTTGLLGLGKIHHYAYHVLPNNDRDRQAFRIQSNNGSVVHFMKTCGNYMYACEQ